MNLDDEEEEITTRQEITFDYSPLINFDSTATRIPDKVLDQNTIIMQALCYQLGNTVTFILYRSIWNKDIYKDIFNTMKVSKRNTNENCSNAYF